MPLKFQISRLPRFVRFDVTGDACLGDIDGLIDRIRDETTGDKRVLVDLSQVRENLKFTDHYAIGELVVRRLAHLERLASVVRADRRTGTSEKVAAAQGTALRVFVDQREACDWLSQH
jgi:hypothetical protein